MRFVAALLLTLVAAPQTATADSTKVAVAPLSTLGEEAKSKATRQVQELLVTACARVGGFTALPSKSVDRALKKAKRRDLRACDGNGKCLAEMGAVVGANVVVYGELGGLGDAQVVYLKAIDVTSGKELRSTTLELGGGADDTTSAVGAAHRLLAPDRYVGQLAANVDVKGATIYVDGSAVAKSPSKPVPLAVGTHALRVTHPEYRDFVRFVDIQFNRDTAVDVELKQFPIVETDMVATDKPKGLPEGAQVVYRGQETLPWYRRWYTVAGGSAVLFVGTAVLVGLLADGITVDDERVIDPPR